MVILCSHVMTPTFIQVIKMAAHNVKSLLTASRLIVRRHSNILELQRPQVCARRNTSSEVYTDEEKEFQERLKRLRDASGLDSFQRARLHGTMPYFEAGQMKSKKMTERRFLRHIYAVHGMASGNYFCFNASQGCYFLY